jgi:hypothetical protein
MASDARATTGLISETTLAFHIASGAVTRAYALARNTEPGSLMFDPRATRCLNENDSQTIGHVQMTIRGDIVQHLDVLKL